MTKVSDYLAAAAVLARFKRVAVVFMALALALNAAIGVAGGLTLKNVEFSSLPGDNLQLVLSMDGPAVQPRAFHTENPARIALDLPGVANGLDKKPILINTAGAQSLQALESQGRTRVVVNLADMVPYTTRVEGNQIIVTLQNSPIPGAAPVRAAAPSAYRSAPEYASSSRGYAGKRIENVDFRRGERGEGRLLITLNDPNSIANIKEEGRQVVVRLGDTDLPPKLARKMDVLDFATPVQYIQSSMDGNDARLSVTPVSEEYEYSSYQTGKLLTVEFRPLSKAEKDDIKKKAFRYSGEKLTLNFQDIPVRSVLQILADFTNLNIVASDTVQGNVTLRLEDVPWDQALDLVLKAKSLGKRQEGNIIRVAPLDEMNKQEKDELEAMKVVEDLEPLRTEMIQLNYTEAEKIKEILVGTTKKTVDASSGQSDINSDRSSEMTSTVDVSQSILSSRGNVTVDPRTNQLIVKDTARNLERVRELVRQLDKPVRQVLIESRIVIAQNNFTRELGSRLMLNRAAEVEAKRGKSFTQVVTDPVSGERVSQDWQQNFSGKTGVSGDALVDLASTAAAASGGYFGVTFIKVGEYLLDLELSAAQIDGRSETVASPKLVTADKTEATILQGQEIPYTVTSAAGGAAIATVQFKRAVMQLKVTPHITPDDNIQMKLFVKKDEPSAILYNGVPAIEKREITTEVQVGNGDTVVLGGVYEAVQRNQTDKVPFLGDLPGVGFMFRKDKTQDDKKELLIFITPKILDMALSAR
jgi:type IV pilus assembly protein PilQ